MNVEGGGREGERGGRSCIASRKGTSMGLAIQYTYSMGLAIQ